MIDFRYHLVSLISMFLALAVGIVLGAGPLKDTIGDQLSGQVEQLREDKDSLRSDLKKAQTQASNSSAFQDAGSADLLAGQLDGKAVALIVLPGAEKKEVDAVTERVTQAKGTISAQVTILAKWYEPGQRTFRQNVATSLLNGVDSPPPASAGQEADLGAALAVGLSNADPADPNKTSNLAGGIIDTLKTSELIAVDEQTDGPASSVIVLSGPAEKHPDSDAAKGQDAAYLGIVSQAAQRTSAVVVAGPGTQGKDFLQTVRDDDDVNSKVSTVDGVENVSGQLSVPLALANALAKEVGHFGFRKDATAIAPPRIAEAPDTTPAPADPEG